MPQGCWIDLYETPDFSGQRRRVFGPGELDAFVWRRFEPSEVISIHLGPQAMARVRRRDGTDRLLGAGEKVTGLIANDIQSMSISRSVDASDDEVDAKPHRPAAHGVVRRDVDDPPPTPSERRKRKQNLADDQTPESVGEGDETS